MPNEKLVQSVDPSLDKSAAKNGAVVVINSTAEEIYLLAYCPHGNCWYITGHQSVQSATGEAIPEASFYWRGIGYVNEAMSSYALLIEDDHLSIWNDIYSDLKGELIAEDSEENLF